MGASSESVQHYVEFSSDGSDRQDNDVSSQPGHGPNTSTEGLRILVVDDDEDFANRTADSLRDAFAGCSIEVSFSGLDASRKLGQFRPHLMVLDLYIPDLNGFVLCHRIKADPDFRDVRVIAVSAFGSPSNIERISHLGANAFVSKPMSDDELLEAVRRSLN